MGPYQAPLRDTHHVIEDVLGLHVQWAAVPAPITASGDLEGCALTDGPVRTPRGFKEDGCVAWRPPARAEVA